MVTKVPETRFNKVYAHSTGPYAGFWFQEGVLCQAEMDFSGPTTTCYTLINSELGGGAHIHSYNV